MLEFLKPNKIFCDKMRLYIYVYLYRFKICRDCYLDATKDGGLCPGCKEPYKIGEYEEDDIPLSSGALTLPASVGATNSADCGMSLMKRNQPGDFDHNKLSYETNGTYGGVGNAYKPPNDDNYGEEDARFGDAMNMNENMEKPLWKPLTRTIHVPHSILSPYRYHHYQLIQFDQTYY